MKKASLPTIIILILALVSMALIMIGISGQNIVLVGSGMALAFASIIAGPLVLSVINTLTSKKTSTSQKTVDAAQIPYSPDPVISRILANPYVLLDERIKQLPEVQNLLQYPEIQQVFFEPAKLYELFTQERVSELLNIVRGRLTQNDGEEIFAAAERCRPVNIPQTVRTDKSAQSSPPKKRSAIFVILFIVVWLMVFISIVSTVMMSVWHHKL